MSDIVPCRKHPEYGYKSGNPDKSEFYINRFKDGNRYTAPVPCPWCWKARAEFLQDIVQQLRRLVDIGKKLA